MKALGEVSGGRKGAVYGKRGVKLGGAAHFIRVTHHPCFWQTGDSHALRVAATLSLLHSLSGHLLTGYLLK